RRQSSRRISSMTEKCWPNATAGASMSDRHQSIFSQAYVCPRCKQPVLVTGLALSPIQKRIFEIVQKHPGITPEELRGLVWAHDPNGGPENRHTIFVHISRLNRALAPLGLMVRCEGGQYCIRSVS